MSRSRFGISARIFRSIRSMRSWSQRVAWLGLRKFDCISSSWIHPEKRSPPSHTTPVRQSYRGSFDSQTYASAMASMQRSAMSRL